MTKTPEILRDSPSSNPKKLAILQITPMLEELRSEDSREAQIKHDMLIHLATHDDLSALSKEIDVDEKSKADVPERYLT